MKLNLKALNRATIKTIWLVVIMTIWSEMNKPFKEFLAGITGHHWVTKGVFSVFFFVLIYLILKEVYKNKKDEFDIKKETMYLIGSTVLGGLAIFIFYIWHYFA